MTIHSTLEIVPTQWHRLVQEDLQVQLTAIRMEVAAWRAALAGVIVEYLSVSAGRERPVSSSSISC